MKCNRRCFVRRWLPAFLAGPLVWKLFGCSRSTASARTDEEWLSAVGRILFPGEPSIDRMHFARHFRRVIADKNYDSDIRLLLRRGLAAFKRFAGPQDFFHLSRPEQEKLFARFVDRSDLNAAWTGALMEVLWESVLLDPHYGVNDKMTGWKWIRHAYGKPRPDASADYAALLAKRSRSEVIRSPGQL